MNMEENVHNTAGTYRVCTYSGECTGAVYTVHVCVCV